MSLFYLDLYFISKKKNGKKMLFNYLSKALNLRNSHFLQVFIKKRSKTFQTITWKHLCQGLFSAKKETQAQVF